MTVQRKVFIRWEGQRFGRLYIDLDLAALRMMDEAGQWRGESPAAFLQRAVRNAIAHEHAAVAAEQAWSERPYDEC